MNKILMILLLASVSLAGIKITEFKVCGDSVRCFWDAVPDTDVVLYRLHFWRGMDNRFVLTPTTTVIVKLLAIPDSVFQRWNFAVQAQDRSGNCSGYSDSLAGYFTGAKHRLYGDIDGDGRCNIYDLLLMLRPSILGRSDLKFDLNDDGRVDITDLMTLLPLLGRSK